jgi:hypothetical protein
MNGTETLQPVLSGVQRKALIAGVSALALCVAGAFLNPAQFLRSYLVAFLFWLGIALGSAAVVMLHHLVGGRWGFVIRRLLESATRTLPAMAVLLLPILLGVRSLYHWTHPAGDHLLEHKAPYLNIPFFIIRAVIYFAVWIGVTWVLNRWSLEQDRTGAPGLVRRMQVLSGPGLLLYGLTVTFASIDWAMSLEPHWFSTIYGMIFMVGQGLATLAFVIAVLMLLSRYQPLSGTLTPDHFHDLGNLMFAFVMLWAYVSFSQFLIIWSGNLPEEIPWYLARLRGGWQWVALILLVFHFFLPFLLLLMRPIKRRAHVLARVAIAVILVRLLDLFWLVTPAFHPGKFHLHWMDVAAPIGVGGLWLAAFLSNLKRAPLLPLRDPRFS